MMKLKSLLAVPLIAASFLTAVPVHAATSDAEPDIAYILKDQNIPSPVSINQLQAMRKGTFEFMYIDLGEKYREVKARGGEFNYSRTERDKVGGTFVRTAYGTKNRLVMNFHHPRADYPTGSTILKSMSFGLADRHIKKTTLESRLGGPTGGSYSLNKATYVLRNYENVSVSYYKENGIWYVDQLAPHVPNFNGIDPYKWTNM